MKCAVKTCNNNNDGKASSFSFFRFPTDAALQKQWLIFCGRDKKINPKTSHICMEHFKAEDFENNMKFEMGFAKKRILKPGAIPTINTNATSADTGRLKQPKLTEKRKNQENIDLVLEEHNYALKSSDENNYHRTYCHLRETKEAVHMEGLRMEIEALRKENEILKSVQKQQSADLEVIKEEIRKIKELIENNFNRNLK